MRCEQSCCGWQWKTREVQGGGCSGQDTAAATCKAAKGRGSGGGNDAGKRTCVTVHGPRYEDATETAKLCWAPSIFTASAANAVQRRVQVQRRRRRHQPATSSPRALPGLAGRASRWAVRGSACQGPPEHRFRTLSLGVSGWHPGQRQPRHQCISESGTDISPPPASMSLVSGPGRAAMAQMPADLQLFVDKHVRYIQSLDTVRSFCMAAQAMGQHSPALTRFSAKTSSSTGSPSICVSTASIGD